MAKNRVFLHIAYISKVRMASLNSAEGAGGNIVPIKKIQSFNNKTYTYVSGQALRRYIKEVLALLGEHISAVDKDGNPFVKGIIEKGKIQDKKHLYEECADLDLFGFMLPKAERRWSPVKVSPLISCLPFAGQKDFLTRKQAGEERGGAMVNVEVEAFNFMSGTIMIHVDNVGKDINEYTYEKKDILGDERRKKRINKLIDAIKYFSGGAKQARLLEDIAPKFVIAVKQKTGNPFLLDLLKVDENENIVLSPIGEALEDNKKIINTLAVGIRQGVFHNEEAVARVLKIDAVKTVSEALELLKL